MCIRTGQYGIKARHSGKVLAIPQAQRQQGVEVIQWDWLNTLEQHFNVIRLNNVGEDWFRIENVNSGLVLAISRKSGESGGNATVCQWGWSNGQEQMFKIEEVDRPFYRITAGHSGKVIAVSQAQTTSGARVIQWDWTGGPEQQFYFFAV